MPPVAKRNCGVILFDVNSSNKQEALTALMKICTFNWLADTKDTYRLILSNTSKSKNIKHYTNLYDTGISCSDPQPILNLISNIEPAEGNWLDAVSLAISHLKSADELREVITLQILYITKLNGCSQVLELDRVEKIVTDLKKYGIYLYIIGPEVKFPFTITDNKEVSRAMKDITLLEESKPLTAAKRIVDMTSNTVLCDLKTGVNLFYAYKNSRGLQPWKVPLSFGSRLEIPASTVKIYKPEMPFKLTKSVYPGKYILLEDESVTVEFSNLVSGIHRHGKFVKIEDQSMFKIEGPRSFAVIGFAEKHQVPEYFMREGTYYVLPDPAKPKDCAQAMYNLIDVLAEEDKYAIARRVYNANNKPKFYVLVPQPDLEPKCFAMAELPYADSLRQKFKCAEPVSSGKVEDDEFVKFFDSIDVTNERCKVKVPLGPKMTVEYYTMKLTNAVANKYLSQKFPFNAVDLSIAGDVDRNEFADAVKASWQQDNVPQEDEEMDDS